MFKPIVVPSSAALHPSVSTAAHGPWVQPLAPSGAPGPRMPPAATNGQINLSLNSPLLKWYQPYMARPLNNISQQTNALQLVQEFGLDPYTHHHHSSATHQALPAYVNPYQFAENQPPNFSAEHPKNLQEPYSRYFNMGRNERRGLG